MKVKGNLKINCSKWRSAAVLNLGRWGRNEGFEYGGVGMEDSSMEYVQKMRKRRGMKKHGWNGQIPGTN